MKKSLGLEKKLRKRKEKSWKKEKLTGRKKDREADRIKYDEAAALEGTFIGHPKGFGFVEIPDQEEDIFIPEEKTGTALHQDKVRIIVEEKQKEGKRRKTKRRDSRTGSGKRNAADCGYVPE